MRRNATLGFALLAAAALAASAAMGSAGRRIAVTNHGEMDPVVFDHTRHAEEMACDTCHHPSATEGAHRCGACHGPQAAEGAMSLEEAAHKEGVGKCWRCHQGPKARKRLACEGCHTG